ncbi:tRNA (adenosine(37)-N6)-threonylcarbamoyltransferase complex ATPase subunit type 1 TsaE [Microbacterium jejuense]|uniref:tRNA (adenosine(37)-N6)-threonylcarbamoyltransferase complex ATPase subunit type 1 TsaE n=1 Tax=Microbacterium jejuense TaxID=1263637 RepID=UPI0031E91438
MSGLDPILGTHEIMSPGDMEALGRRIGGMLRPGDLVVLTGPLGAGKTTLTRGIGAGLNVRGPIQSPTFVLARTHPSLDGGAPLVHVDAYRLGSAAELDDLDIDFDGSVVVVEWGRGMVDGIRDVWWELEIEREWHGHGVDDACGTVAHEADLDADAPRRVKVTRHGAPTTLEG